MVRAWAHIMITLLVFFAGLACGGKTYPAVFLFSFLAIVGTVALELEDKQKG